MISFAWQIYHLTYTMYFRNYWTKKVIWGISRAELGIWLLYNFFWGAFFLLVLIVAYQPGSYIKQAGVVALDISVKMILTLPAWWLVFRCWRRKSVGFLLRFHLAYMVLFAIAWLYGWGYLAKWTLLPKSKFDFNAMLVDLYISAFFYGMQFAVFHAYNLLLRTKRQLLREQELKDLAYQSEIKALKAQIEPHFLFNTLNSISASVPPSLEKTRVLIAQLADTFRYALKVSERQYVTLDDELSFIKTWLALEHHRFGDRLKVEYDIEASVLGTTVPPMILQPLVENALNHGISPLVKGGTVSIICRHEDGFVNITVSDTGVGYEGNIDELLLKGIGLKSTAQRIERLYNEKLMVKRNLKGLRVVFRVPASMALH